MGRDAGVRFVSLEGASTESREFHTEHIRGLEVKRGNNPVEGRKVRHFVLEKEPELRGPRNYRNTIADPFPRKRTRSTQRTVMSLQNKPEAAQRFHFWCNLRCNLVPEQPI